MMATLAEIGTELAPGRHGPAEMQHGPAKIHHGPAKMPHGPAKVYHGAAKLRHGPACPGHLSRHVPAGAARTSRAMTRYSTHEKPAPVHGSCWAQRSSPAVPPPTPSSTPSPRCPAPPSPAPRGSSPCIPSASPATFSATQIVQTSEDYRVVLRGTDWWAEPLDAMLTRVLAQDLTERLPQTTVYTSAGAVTGSPEATIEVELSRLDLDRAGNLLLIGQASVSFKSQPAPDTRSLRISQPLPSPGVEGQIAATSTAIAQVADEIAGMLTAAPGRR